MPGPFVTLFLPTQLPSDSDFLDCNHLQRIPAWNSFQIMFALSIFNFECSLNSVRIQLSLQKPLRSLRCNVVVILVQRNYPALPQHKPGVIPLELPFQVVFGTSCCWVMGRRGVQTVTVVLMKRQSQKQFWEYPSPGL